YSINGVTFEDEAFARLVDSNGDGKVDENDITVEGRARNSYEKTSNISYQLYNTADPVPAQTSQSNGETTPTESSEVAQVTDAVQETETAQGNETTEKVYNAIKFKTDETINTDGQKIAGGVIFTFKTKPSDSELAQLMAGETTEMKNTAFLNAGTSYRKQSSASHSYTPDNKITKTLDEHEDKVIKLSEITADTKEELDWTIEMRQDLGFADANNPKLFVDVMGALNSDKTTNAQADHYIDLSKHSVKVYDESDNVLPSSYYTVTYYSNSSDSESPVTSGYARSFNIIFDEAVDTAGYDVLLVKYTSIADISNVTSEAKISFNNTASFNTKSSTPSDTYVVDIYDDTSVDYSKTAINADMEELSGESAKLDFTEVETAFINNVEYYIFGWKIKLNLTEDGTTLIDTFDEGFTLCTDDTYKPKIEHDWGHGTTSGFIGMSRYTQDNQNCYVYNDNTNTVRFALLTKNVLNIAYFTKIPVKEFDPMLIEAAAKTDVEGVVVKNSVKDSLNKYEAISSEVLVTGEPEIEVEVTEPTLPDMGDVIEKTYNPQSASPNDEGVNIVSYTLDINKDAKDLASGDELILNDAFVTEKLWPKGSWYGETCWNELTGVDIVDVILRKVNIYEVQSDNTPVELPSSEYSYLFYPGGEKTAPVNVTKELTKANREWLFTGFKPGDVVTVTFKGTPGLKIDKSVNDMNVLHLEMYDLYDANKKDVQINETFPAEFDDQGLYTYTFVMPDNANKFYAKSWNVDLKDISVTAVGKVSTSELNLTIPDATHIKIKYEYELIRNGEALTPGDKIFFSNTAYLTGNGMSSSTVDNISLEIIERDGVTSVAYLPTIKKVDVSDYTVEGLNAKFKLAKYNDSKWQWYSQPIATKGVIAPAGWSDSSDNPALLSTVDGEFEIDGFESGGLYALVEVEGPSADYEDVSKVKPYYFTYAKTLTSYPTGLNGERLDATNVKTIRQNGEIPVTNNRLVDISVTKTWDEPQENASVTAELYWSYKRVLNGFPSEMTLATAENLGVDTLENPVQFTDAYQWNDLPNGKNGKVIYYYVKETDYTINGTKTAVGSGEFSPIYRGNGINESDSVIKITNASSLQLKKVWCDLNNVLLPDSFIPVEEVEVKLWGKVNYADSEELIKNGTEDTFKITKAGGWKLKLTPQQLDNYQYFTVEEVVSGELTDYAVSYSYNYEAHTGSITITNKADFEVPYTDITVKKLWYDGDGTNRPTSLELKLMQKTSTSDWTEAENQTPDLVKNGNEWIFTYKNLLAKDAANNEIYYKVEETVPDGYSLTAINNDGVNSTPEEDPIILANTKTLSIEIEKKWNESNHMLDKVLVDVYRSTNEDLTNPELVQENIEISASTDWKAVVNDLPAYDGLTGKQYY
ncbi:MAG: Cna B-type domain-containing protein, partial [Oscillospiraceae bacterium]|nr:Cna B-type domain-containing protein [Oscillospiraceae bacterium]